MINTSKQFAGWGTASKKSDFKKAAVTLTIFYTIGVFVVLIVFNFLVYGLFANSLDVEEMEEKEYEVTLNDSDRDEENGVENFLEERNEQIQDDLAKILVISDLIILFATVFVAYFLAKRTLLPLEEAYKKQTRFVADAAHELRTPLSVMQAGSEVILRGDRSIGEYTKFINESLDEIKRLTKLSNDLLFLARSDKKQTKTFSKINLSEVCGKQSESVKSYARSKNIFIHESIESGVVVFGSEDDLTRLMLNLLKNAVDYNMEGGAIHISLKKVGREAILNVADTGVGIETNAIPFIFDRFYKADSSRTVNSSGSGLGLAIVREIVEEHGGKISVLSKLGSGTDFEISLPLS